jgi:hypothetical protein
MNTVTTRSVRRVAQAALGELLGHKRGTKRKTTRYTKRWTPARGGKR